MGPLLSLSLQDASTMANCSPDVIWSLVKDTSCHVLKRKVSGRTQMGKAGVHLTLEPNNLTGINSFKYSGMGNAKTVGIEPTEKGIVLTTKSRKSDRIRKPSKLFNKVTLTNKPFRKIAKTIISQTSGNFYRADLQHAALAKWSILHKAQKRSPNPVLKKFGVSNPQKK